jgi:dienelactone hydrolase
MLAILEYWPAHIFRILSRSYSCLERIEPAIESNIEAEQKSAQHPFQGVVIWKILRMFGFRGIYTISAVIVGVACATIVSASANEIVTFDSAKYLVGELQQRLALQRGESATSAPVTAVRGFLSKPTGKGPFPAVVYLHGCGGLSEYARKSTADQMTKWGFVSLVVDSYTTRGVKETCSMNAPAYREADAFGALLYLSKLPFVDPERIALVGHSQGGIAALQVASFHAFDTFDIPAGLAYRAVVAFYPMCSAAEDELAIPTIILSGELDDWVPVTVCRRWMQRRAGRGAPVKLVVYPGAYHDFDVPGVGDGKRYFGHWLKYDVDAATRSTTEMHNFLSAQLLK